MKKKLFISLSVLSGFVAIWIIMKLIPTKEVLELFSHSSIKVILGYVFISIAILIVLTWRWDIILKSQKIKIPFITLCNYRLIGYGISYLTPTAKLGGEPVRAALLGKQNIGFSKALSSVFIDKAIETASSALFFFIGVLIVLFKFALPGQTEITMLLFAIVFLAILIFIYQRIASGKGIITSVCKAFKLDKIKRLGLSEKKLISFENLIIKFFQKDKKYFLIALIASFISWVLMFIEFKLAGLILGFDFSFTTIFLIASFVGAAYMIPIPMAIGSLEASQVAVFQLIDLKSSAGVAFALVTRARDLLWSAICMILLGYYGIRITKTIKKGYVNNNYK